MSARRLPLLLCLLVLTAACGAGSSTGEDPPSYTPVADSDLFAQIAELPGVESADVTFNDTAPENTYVGQVTVSDDVDPQDVLDEAHAVLRQGRYDVDINLEAVQGDRAITFDRLPGSGLGTRANLQQRYGPQPGTGLPPT